MSATPWNERDHGAMARTLGAARGQAESVALARLAELVGVVFRLRDADGCPWDRKQSLTSMARNLQEEAAETADAVAEGDDAHVAEELGDTLMNVLLMARIGVDEGRFDLAGVAASIAEKLVRRHPHVFGDVSAEDAEAALKSWNDSKAEERQGERPSALDGVPASLPALLAARKLGGKAAATGFDWPDTTGALEKLNEEVAELQEAVEQHAAHGSQGALDHVADELGDVLFAAVNVARKTGLDPDLALRGTLAKFRRRFAHLEAELGDGLSAASLERMEALWRQAADAEPGPPAAATPDAKAPD